MNRPAGAIILFTRLFGRHWRAMGLGILLGTIALISAVGLLALSGWFISACAAAGLSAATAHLFNFFYPSVGVRLLAMMRTAARYGERIVTHDATFRILETLRVWFYRQLEPLTPGQIASYRHADILNRMVSDIDALDNLYLRLLSPGITALAMILLVVSCLWVIDGSMALTVLCYLSIAAIVVPGITARTSWAMGPGLAASAAELRIRVVEGIEGMGDLIAFGGDRRQLQQIKTDQHRLVDHQRKMSRISGMSSAAITLTSGFCMITILYIGTGKVELNLIGGEFLVVFILGAAASFEAVMPLPAAYQYLTHTVESAGRITEIAGSRPLVAFPSQTFSTPAHHGIRFENLNFRYLSGGPWVVRDVNLTIAAGKKMAVVGETGSGKSSLLNLLIRFQDPVSGTIRIGDVRIDRIRESDLRQLITVVPQQAHMFHASIRDNLLIARPDATEDQLAHALTMACLSDFVKTLPDGLDTWVGESGSRLSGGQGRRIAVARAILADAPIWLLDEPTEGLDRTTEKNLILNITRLTQGRTVMFITHRRALLADMDQVVEMSRGKIVSIT
ncbi:MAG: thiol reductant ABC exporter subunit CydC [Desulfobacteraceae bacterium]|nr:thiol reductant ABC exporter subunit CydC [Desulfobacteraceae bacterium]